MLPPEFIPALPLRNFGSVSNNFVSTRVKGRIMNSTNLMDSWCPTEWSNQRNAWRKMLARSLDQLYNVMRNKAERDEPKVKARRSWGEGGAQHRRTAFCQRVGGTRQASGKRLSQAPSHPSGPPRAVKGESGESGSWPPRDGAFDHRSSFTACLTSLRTTLYQQSINAIDLHVPGNAVLLRRRGSWLHFCIKGSDYIKGMFGFSTPWG